MHELILDKILTFSITHRIFVLLGTFAIAIAGVFALRDLPIDAVPDITNNQIQINTQHSGLSPIEMEKQVTFPIETALAGIPGLDYTRSLSRNGFSQVTAVFHDDVDIYFARSQATERLTSTKELLPLGAEPALGAISTGLGEVYIYTVSFAEHSNAKNQIKNGEPGWQSDSSYLTEEGELLKTELERAVYLRTIQDWVIKPQLKNLPGVAGVDTIGGHEKEYHVQPDPKKLASFQLTFSDVVAALERNNSSIGAGYVEMNGESYLVRSASRIEHTEDISSIVVGSRDGTPIFIRDIAEVGLGKTLRMGSASRNGEEAVIGTALMLIGANSRTVAKSVEDRITQINAQLPAGIEAKAVLNRTKLVEATIKTVKTNLLEGAVLVIAVLLFMLGNLRAALITAMAIPLSMLIAAIGMVDSKISGNLMSLGAIDFGLVVDGAVIMIENCIRNLSHTRHQLGRDLSAKERVETITAACKEVRGATVFGEAIIMIVYIPILFLNGIEGKMFHPMAMTVVFALFAAFILSLTFIPAMAALFLSGSIEDREGRAMKLAKKLYAHVLRLTLRYRGATVILAVVTTVASLGLLASLGQEFAPVLDEKDIAIETVRIPSTSITQSTTTQMAIERAALTVPEVSLAFSKTGTPELATDPMPPSVSDTFIVLKDRANWPNPAKSKLTLINEIDEVLQEVPGSNYEFSQPIQLRFNELLSGVRSDIAVKVFGEDFDAMLNTGNKVARVLRSINGAADVRVEQIEGLPVMDIKVKRDNLARMGLSVSDVHEVISTALGGRKVGVIYEGDRRVNIKVALNESARSDLAIISSLPIPLPGKTETEIQNHGIEKLIRQPSYQNRMVPLEAVAEISLSEGPNQVSRENGKRRVVVQANVRGRDIGSFVAEAQDKIKSIKPPTGGWFEWGGQFENLETAKSRLLTVVPVCFSLIFLLLYSSFNSVRHALVVFLAVPLGLSGGVIALWLRAMPFSISAAVGFIALSGVAVLNGLVLVSFINTVRKQGSAIDEAIQSGSVTRLRPVLMTALVASLGFLPMALGSGTGAEVQRPIATVVIGGLISSTLLTLLVIPAMYSLLCKTLNKEPV
jgi:heavy metal efflux system protein